MNAKRLNKLELARYLDHAILQPDMNKEEVKEAINKGIKSQVYSICVKPCDIEIALDYTKNTNTLVSVVLDFPHGHSSLAIKKAQAIEFCQYQICDIDMVVNYSNLVSNDFKAVEKEMKEMVEVVHKYGKVLKTIIETDALNDEQIKRACEIASKCGVDFVKTSTGFYPGEKAGATIDICQFMINHVFGHTKVKGSGNVRNKEHFLKLIDLGVQRIGCGFNSTEKLLEE